MATVKKDVEISTEELRTLISKKISDRQYITFFRGEEHKICFTINLKKLITGLYDDGTTTNRDEIFPIIQGLFRELKESNPNMHVNLCGLTATGGSTASIDHTFSIKVEVGILNKDGEIFLAS